MPRQQPPSPQMDESGCLIWKGMKDAYGHPIQSVKGKIVRVAQEVFERTHGYRPIRTERTCGKRLCILPSHITDSRASKEEAELQATIQKRQSRVDYLKLALQNLSIESGPEVEVAKQKFQQELDELEKGK